MKGHGVIRRVDNLGRIVLPIHFRKFLNIFENDDVLITLDQDQIIISKNDTFHGKTQTFKSICVSLYTIVGGTILICDHEKIVASYGIKSNLYLEGLYLSEDLKKRIKKDSFLSSNLSLITVEGLACLLLTLTTPISTISLAIVLLFITRLIFKYLSNLIFI